MRSCAAERIAFRERSMAEYVISEFKWGPTQLGTAGGQVRWSFATRSYDGYTYEGVIVDPIYQSLIRDAFQQWEAVANIDFVEVSDGTSTQLRLGWDSIDGPHNTVGEASYSGITTGGYNPQNPRYSTTDAEIRFDLAETWSTTKSAPASGSVSFYAVALHEIGHVLGLDHTTDPGTLMYPRLTDLTSLAAGDIEGARVIYGHAALAQLFAANIDIARGLSASYQYLLGGVPNEGGYTTLIANAVVTNFGAGAGTSFNTENVFINLANNLVQGNNSAGERFDELALGETLVEKIAALYQSIVPAAHQSAEGLAYLTRPDGIAFFQQVAAERGLAGVDGTAIVAMASLMKIVVSEDIGIGDAINDLIAAVAAGTHAIPPSGSAYTHIEIADGTQFDGDDGNAVVSMHHASSEMQSNASETVVVGVQAGGISEFA